MLLLLSLSLLLLLSVTHHCHHPCPSHLFNVVVSALAECLISRCHQHHQHCIPLHLLSLIAAMAATRDNGSSFSSIIVAAIVVVIIVVIVVRRPLLSSPLPPLIFIVVFSALAECVVSRHCQHHHDTSQISVLYEYVLWARPAKARR